MFSWEFCEICINTFFYRTLRVAASVFDFSSFVFVAVFHPLFFYVALSNFFTVQKMIFSIKDFFSKCDQFPADLVTFTEEILNRKPHFFVQCLFLILSGLLRVGKVKRLWKNKEVIWMWKKREGIKRLRIPNTNLISSSLSINSNSRILIH